MGQMTNLPAFLLVFFGTIGATTIGYDYHVVMSIPKMLKSIIRTRLSNPNHVIDTLVRLAKIARMKGILALDEVSTELNDPFLQKGIQLVIDGTPSAIIRDVMETETAALQERHRAGESFFSAMGGYSPTMGIIGTVLGLINMLARLDEPGKMGHAIGAAFTATLYGVCFANLLYLPIASKLKTRTNQEINIQEMIMEGILAIQSGESPRSIESRMLSFLSPQMRLKRQSSYTEYDEEMRAA